MVKQITTIDALKKYDDYDVVELPAFGPDKPFVAKLRRPSLLVMAKNGTIPNTLLGQANSMFFGNTLRNAKPDNDVLAKLFDIIEIMCKCAFVEPTYDQIKEAGIQMNDQQYLAVYNYTQEGVQALSSFRGEQGNI